MMTRLLFTILACALFPWRVQAQEPVFSHEHGFYDEPFELTIETELDEGSEAVLRYTLDGSEPTEKSELYDGKPLAINGTTIVRAALFDGDVCLSSVTTATYLFIKDILRQSNTPKGYPDTWGRYTTIKGTAKADYEMDPEMTDDPELRPKIIEGLQSLPVVSIVTDPDNLFSHENDSVRGGIYIFTGPPVGDDTGHGWTRPASVEIFTPQSSMVNGQSSMVNGQSSMVNGQSSMVNRQSSMVNGQSSMVNGQSSMVNRQSSMVNGQSSMVNGQSSMVNGQSSMVNGQWSCGLRLHGGHGRLPEKNPKHSFRLVFKEKYGPKTLKYPLFGDDQPAKFDQLVLRCHFGNSWQHWDKGNRKKAQYTRDVWARRMQRRLGRTSVNALYVNLFLNGMYWGLYNIAERVDDQFGKDHIGGEKAGVDVIKIEESGGNHLEASEGTLDAWKRMTTLAAIVGGAAPSDFVAADGSVVTTPEEAYAALSDSLLDIPSFIDYMLINQYGGNTDWDHHNWYAVRSSGADSKGFRILCWDSEVIGINVEENNLSKNNGKRYPSGIFHNLLHNGSFARQYLRRAKELLAPEGLLGEESVVELWDSLHSVITPALYAEAARWGDYRRDVHQYTSKGELYTVDNHYAAERDRLLTQYFPYRSDIVLGQITSYLNIDDIKGDVNGDGDVNVADISAIISVMAGGGTDVSSASLADVNGDGHIDVADVSAVITIMASK